MLAVLAVEAMLLVVSGAWTTTFAHGHRRASIARRGGSSPQPAQPQSPGSLPRPSIAAGRPRAVWSNGMCGDGVVEVW
jgi:hypothetical protein